MSRGWVESTTRALVLSVIDSNDDQLSRVLTAGDVVLPVAGRRARRNTKRSRKRLQALTLVELRTRARPNDEFADVLDADVIESFALIKADLRRLALASTVAEVTLRLVTEHGQEPGVFQLVGRALEHLAQPDTHITADLVALFELRMLTRAGVMPELDALAVSPSAREVLADWQAGRWRQLAESDVMPTRRALELLIVDAAGRGLKSTAFLDQIFGLQQDA